MSTPTPHRRVPGAQGDHQRTVPPSSSGQPAASHPVRQRTGNAIGSSSRTDRIRHTSPESAAAARIRARRAAKRKRRQTMLAAILALLLLVVVACIIGFAAHNALSNAPGDDTADANTGDPAATQEESGPDDTASPADTSPSTTPPDTDLPVVDPIPGKPVVVIDPGHGFSDPGASSDYLLPYVEKDINLTVSLKLRDMLVSEGYEVIMTRDSDTVPQNWPYGDLMSPEDRVDMISKLKNVDYFISIHCNSFAGTSRAYGTRLYYYTENSSETPDMAQAIADGIFNRVNDKQPSLNAYKASQAYTVTRHQICPAVLIEIGFLTDEEDAMKMKDEAWQNNMARGIANGLSAHIRSRENDAA